MLNTNESSITPSNFFASIIMGTNMVGVLTNTGVGWKLILNAAGDGTAGLTTNANQFGASVQLTLKAGAAGTNLNHFSTGTNHGAFYVEGNHTVSAAVIGDYFQASSFGGGFALVSIGPIISESSISETELAYLIGVTSPLQDQLASKQTGSMLLSNLLQMGISNIVASTGIAIGTNGGVLWITNTLSSSAGLIYNFNNNQFETNGGSGTNVSIKSGTLISNVVIWPSNNTSVPLVVTNQAGSISDVMSAYNTNRAGFRVRSNGVMEVKATATGANPSMQVHNDGANQTYMIWTNSNGGNGSFIMRVDNAGNAVFSPGQSGGATYFGGPDSGSGIVYFNLVSVGTMWSMIPSSTVAAWHGGTTRRGQITNVWDIWCRTNTYVDKTNFSGYAHITNSIYAETNYAAFDFTTNDFVLNQYYTNSNQRSWTAANISLTNVLATDKAMVSLYLDQDGSGAFERTGIEARLQGVALSSATEQLSAFLQPNARFIFTNFSAGTATATVEPNSSQWVRQ